VVLFAAVFANSINLEGVASGEVAVFAAYFLLEAADILREKFDRTAAVGADHVVMAATVVLVLVAGNTVVEGDLAGQAALRQQFQRAVDGGISDVGIFFLHQAVQFVGGEMVAGFEKRMQDDVALCSLFQADFF
jgi:hypothetical protein